LLRDQRVATGPHPLRTHSQQLHTANNFTQPTTSHSQRIHTGRISTFPPHDHRPVTVNWLQSTGPLNPVEVTSSLLHSQSRETQTALSTGTQRENREWGVMAPWGDTTAGLRSHFAEGVGTGRPDPHSGEAGTAIHRRTTGGKTVKILFLAVFAECQTKNRPGMLFPRSGEDLMRSPGPGAPGPPPPAPRTAAQSPQFSLFLHQFWQAPLAIPPRLRNSFSPVPAPTITKHAGLQYSNPADSGRSDTPQRRITIPSLKSGTPPRRPQSISSRSRILQRRNSPPVPTLRAGQSPRAVGG